MNGNTDFKQLAIDWVEARKDWLSRTHMDIWHFHEPAWREYRSAAYYVALLRAEGFEVEEGSGGMPTAFCATWGKGGPVIGGYAEYDAVPGNSQDPVPFEQPRAGVHRWAAGHTDPHSALGVGALGGLLAAKSVMEAQGIEGRLKFLGEPAEKVCGSKPVHATKGYYDDMDAAISFHPAFSTVTANSCIWDTHCGAYWSKIYTFECEHPERWAQMGVGAGDTTSHTGARAPGALDALCLMYTTSKYTKEAMLPHTGTWTLNEAILSGGFATSDNLAPRFAQIQYSGRAPTVAMEERIFAVLDNNAAQVAAITGCTWRGEWVTKTRPGLPNHTLAELGYRNLERVGAPAFGPESVDFAREIQRNLGLEPMPDPFLPAMSELHPPRDVEAAQRAILPPWQINYTSDDYTDYTWHTPTLRIYIGRPMLRAPEPDFQYPAWVWNALGGCSPAIDQTILVAAKTIGATILELMTDHAALAEARAEFEERTGGGVGGDRWLAPLLPADFAAPVHYGWPEYVTTARGAGWSVPEGA